MTVPDATASPKESDAAPRASWRESIAVYLQPRVLIVMLLGFSSGLPLALSGSTLQIWMKESGIDLRAIGLFVLVGGLVHTGVISTIGRWAIDVIGTNYFAASTILLFGSAILGAFFDNIPYAATMAPIVEGLVQQSADPMVNQHLWWAFALGADFGGNGTAIAASANVVAIGIAARAGHPISFWQFTKYGVPVTLLSTATAWGYVALRYF